MKKQKLNKTFEMFFFFIQKVAVYQVVKYRHKILAITISQYIPESIASQKFTRKKLKTNASIRNYNKVFQSIKCSNLGCSLIPKKLNNSGKKKWRVVVDCRKLNDVTIADKFPISNIQYLGLNERISANSYLIRTYI